ncbi:hypothetical protein [Kutzneria sp. 744]|uniref:hypothetical protein n=1 Tax=Kutzneria sp. (strain 744) TaxID=345341 RepID=UPI0003EECA7A|nr:hypothetical protein [Kutzneria sp. 744]EWM17528.1 hypothetical protein KUTG_07832 [Kutzneria sp. 744]
MKILLAAAASLALVAGGFGAGVAQAEAAPGCSSTVQIGSTAYIKFQGQDIASVKQFKGCDKNWGYIYVWESFRQRGLHWYLLAAVNVNPGVHNVYQGDTTNLDSVKELWSTGTDTLSECTAGYGLISIVGYDHYSAFTDTRC